MSGDVENGENEQKTHMLQPSKRSAVAALVERNTNDTEYRGVWGQRPQAGVGSQPTEASGAHQHGQAERASK